MGAEMTSATINPVVPDATPSGSLNGHLSAEGRTSMAEHQTTRDYRSDAEWMATYILGRLPDHNTMTPDEIADYEHKLQEIVERVANGIGKP